jgi:hypothetical protein
MHLVENIVRTLQTSSPLSESEIKRKVNKDKRDYGCTNVTLKRLMKHGVLNRIVGICKTTKRPSFLFHLKMDGYDTNRYIAERKEKVAKAMQAKRKSTRDLYNWGNAYTLKKSWNDCPLIICHGLAPVIGEEGMWLGVSDQFSMITLEQENGSTLIGFKKK